MTHEFPVSETACAPEDPGQPGHTGSPWDRVAVMAAQEMDRPAGEKAAAEDETRMALCLPEWGQDADPANQPLPPASETEVPGGVEILTGGDADWPGLDAGAEPANLDLPPEAGFRVDAAETPWEQGETGRWGAVRWRTLLCADRTPSSGLVLGIAEFGPGEALKPHRHGPAEVYYGLEGAGTVTVEGVAHAIGPGVTVYIPAESEHGTVAGPEGLRVLYSFPTARFAEVDYRFSSG